MQFRPVPDNLVSKMVEQSSHDVGENQGEEQTAATVYIPPRVVAMPYKEQVSSLPRSRVEKNKLISELRDELTDFPTEVQVTGKNSNQAMCE